MPKGGLSPTEVIMQSCSQVESRKDRRKRTKSPSAVSVIKDQGRVNVLVRYVLLPDHVI